MDCYLSGFLGLALIGGSVATLSVTKEQHNLLRNVFSDELDKKYETIITERRNLYIKGLVIGLFISYIIINKVVISNSFTRVSLFFLITLGTALIYYMIIPKSDYMLNYLKSPEEIKKWLEVYKTMQKRYIVGFVLGILATIPIAKSLC